MSEENYERDAEDAFRNPRGEKARGDAIKDGIIHRWRTNRYGTFRSYIVPREKPRSSSRKKRGTR